MCIAGKKRITTPSNWYNEKGGMSYLELFGLKDEIKKLPLDKYILQITLVYRLNDDNGYSLVGLTKVGNNGEEHIFASDTLKNTINKWVPKKIHVQYF